LILDHPIDSESVCGRNIQELDSQSGPTAQVPHANRARYQVTGSWQLEAQIESASHSKNLSSFDKGAPFTQITKRFRRPCENTILSEPNLGLNAGANMFPFFFHTLLSLESNDLTPPFAWFGAAISHPASRNLRAALYGGFYPWSVSG
jgi:hypothetical protein